MRFFSSSTPEQDAAKAERDISREQYKAYRKALNQNGDWQRKHGDHEETPTYRQLNKAVIEAEQHVSWWRR